MSVKIIIDSASDINHDEALQMGIIMMPMNITFGEEEYMDGVDLLPRQFYQKLHESKVLPKTSLINSFRFEEEFAKHINAGDEVVAITISSKLSGTFNSAVEASEKFDGKVQVVDSMNAAIGERLLAQYALALSKQGKTAKEIASALNESKSRLQVMAVIDTLEYLKKGGRISGAAAAAGKILAIKPVVAVVDGEVKMIGKAMGSKNGYNLLNKIVKDSGGFDTSLPFGALWSGLDQSISDKYIQDSAALWGVDKDSVTSYILGGTIGTHIGPGAVGVAYFKKA